MNGVDSRWVDEEHGKLFGWRRSLHVPAKPALSVPSQATARLAAGQPMPNVGHAASIVFCAYVARPGSEPGIGRRHGEEVERPPFRVGISCWPCVSTSRTNHRAFGVPDGDGLTPNPSTPCTGSRQSVPSMSTSFTSPPPRTEVLPLEYLPRPRRRRRSVRASTMKSFARRRPGLDGEAKARRSQAGIAPRTAAREGAVFQPAVDQAAGSPSYRDVDQVFAAQSASTRSSPRRTARRCVVHAKVSTVRRRRSEETVP